MSREKQIEEMARDLCESCDNGICRGRGTPCDLQCACGCLAEEFYEKDCRKQKWISVDERLPENYEHCLLFLDNETMEIGWYHETAKIFVVGGLATINIVTHWMPLPEAPKMKGGAE